LKGDIPMSLKGMLEMLKTKNTVEVSLEGNTRIESMLVLSKIRENCTANEFVDIAKECGTEMELYGIVDSQDTVDDAAKEVEKLEDAPSVTEKLGAVKLAEMAEDELFEKYKRFSTLAAAYLGKIEEKYGEQSSKEVSAVVENACRKAASINGDKGKVIIAKIKN
jgi:hypothetical protein